MTRTAYYAVVCAAALAIASVPLFAGGFTITLINYIGVYALVVLGIVLLTGVGGLTSFGQASFVGLAAYSTAWLSTAQQASPWLGLIFALVVTGSVAAFLGAVTLRLGGHFLPISTIAWGLSIYFMFGNLDALGRYNGIANIPPIFIGTISLAPSGVIFYLIWGLLAGAALLVANLLDSREGRAVRSLRGGAIMIESLGVNAFRVRLITFVIAALLAALSGWLYAHMIRYVSPRDRANAAPLLADDRGCPGHSSSRTAAAAHHVGARHIDPRDRRTGQALRRPRGSERGWLQGQRR